MPNFIKSLFVLSSLVLLPLPLHAQTATVQQPIATSATRVKHKLRPPEPSVVEPEIQDIDRVAATMNAEVAILKVVQNFRTFIVEPKDIKAILLGLQEGESVNLTSPANGQRVRVVRKTKAMSLGNAYVALSLAKLDLAQFDIIQPTYEQLYKALNGGSFVQTRLGSSRRIRMQGVLKQYARSRNWDPVAQRLGVSLEPLRYDMQSTAVAMVDRQLTTVTSLRPAGQAPAKPRVEQPGAL